MILPYYGYTPDYGQPTGPLYTALGVLYGLAIFALCGGLLGALAGALITRSSPPRRIGSDTPTDDAPQWRWLTLAPMLLLGLYVGLSLGFLHHDVGGPGPFIPARPALPYDPAGTALGIGLGALAGVLVGLGCAWLMTWAERQPSRFARVKPGSMSQTVNRLTEGGYAVRMPDPHDGRKVLFSLTAEGSRIATVTRARSVAWFETQLERLNPQERAILAQAAALMQRMADD